MKTFPGQACTKLCEDSMPWHGILAEEYEWFKTVFEFTNNIKKVFGTGKYKSDSLVDTWETNKDIIVGNNFNMSRFQKDAFNITTFTPRDSGLSLERLGFKDMKVFKEIQDRKKYKMASNLIKFYFFLFLVGILNLI